MTDEFMQVLQDASGIEAALRARGDDLGPFHDTAHGIGWWYRHAPYYEDRYVRVIQKRMGVNKLENCAHDVRVRVIADIHRRYPDLLPETVSTP